MSEPESTIAVDYQRVVGFVSKGWARRYPVADVEDLAQECRVWLLRNESKVRAWESEHGDAYASRKVSWRLRDVAKVWCISEHAKAVGYRSQDVFWYTPGMVAEILPHIFDAHSYADPGQAEGNPRSLWRREDEGGTRLAAMTDVAFGFDKLGDDDRKVLALRYHEGLSMEELGAALECSPTTADKRAERALGRLVARLGGEPPYWKGTGSKKVTSNASAINRTGRQ